MFKPKNKVLVSNYQNIKKKNFSNVKIHFNKSEIILLNFYLDYYKKPKLSFIRMKYNLKHKQIQVKNSEIDIIKYKSSRVSLTNLVLRDKRGFFNKR